MRFRATLMLGALLVVSTAGAVFGQGFQGGLRGSIKDAGGVVPGVEVTLTNESTSIKRSTVTNERGEYVFAAVEPGTYAVKATLQGYKTVDRGAIRIGTQQFLTLDLTMEVGSITENVTVTGQAPLIDTSNASTGTVLDSAALQTLPSPGRNAFMLGASVPTVVPSGDAQFNRQQDQTNSSLMSLGGGTRRGNNYTLDGVPITDMRNRMSAVPTTEGVDDLKVQVHTYDAEMGRTGGGVFNVTAKSGTNNFHGTAFFQTRPIWGQTNNYFSQIASDTAAAKGDSVTAAKLGKPNSPYYLGGGAVGGPIVKDRTFFWFSNEQYHDVQTRNSSARMPTAAERAGDFSGLLNSAGQPVVIYDPLTKLPFPGNIIPASRINPVAANMIKYLPLPDTNLDNASNNYNRTSLISNNFETEIAMKVEHKFTDKVSLTGFYLYNRTNEPCQNYFGSADQNDPNRFADPLDYILARRPQLLALNNTWVLNDSSVMSLRFGMTRFPDNNTLTLPFDPATLGFSSNYLALPTVQKFPQVDLTGYDALAGRTLGAINPTEVNWKSTSVNAAYSRFFGSHTVKAGGDYRKIGVDTYIPGAPALHVRQRVHFGEQLEQQRDLRQFRRLVPARLPVSELGEHQSVRCVDAVEPVHLLLRRLRAGRLARELEVHAQLRSAPRARDRDGGAEQQLHRRLRPGDHERAVVGHHSGGPGGGNGLAPGDGRADVRGRQRQPDDAGQSAEAEGVAARRRGLLVLAEHGPARRLRRLLGALQLSGAVDLARATTGRSATRSTRSWRRRPAPRRCR